MSDGTRLRLSVIVPVYREAARLPHLIPALCNREDIAEVVLVDASRDAASAGFFADYGLSLQDQFNHKLLMVGSPDAGRSVQMNLGAELSLGNALLFLHADTELPKEDIVSLLNPLPQVNLWGRFDVQLIPDNWLLCVVAAMMNWRSRLSGIATGDQCLFIDRATFEQVGGFRDMALMEDIELSRRLKKLSRPLCLRETVSTSSRRWLEHGVVKTIVLMWCLRLLYWVGLSPKLLAKWYRHAR